MTKGCIDITVSPSKRVDAFYESMNGNHFGLFDLPYEEVKTSEVINVQYLIDAFNQKYRIDIASTVNIKISYFSSTGANLKKKRVQPSLQAAQKKRKTNVLSKVWGTLLFRNSLSVLRKIK